MTGIYDEFGRWSADAWVHHIHDGRMQEVLVKFCRAIFQLKAHDSAISSPEVFRVTDLGCGRGEYIKAIAADLEAKYHSGIVSAVGYDADAGLIEPDPLVAFATANLATTWQFLPADVVLCLEVAEHIPAKHSGSFLANLRQACKVSGYLVLSWAMVGQGGLGHVNEKNQTDVIELLDSYGFCFLPYMATEFENVSMPWFRRTMVFQKVA